LRDVTGANHVQHVRKQPYQAALILSTLRLLFPGVLTNRVQRTPTEVNRVQLYCVVNTIIFGKLKDRRTVSQQFVGNNILIFIHHVG